MSLNYQRDYNRRIHDWIRQVKEKARRLSSSGHLEHIDCPSCRSSESRFFVNNDSLDYVKCVRCDLVYMNPRPAEKDVNDGFQGEDKVLMEYFRIVLDFYDPRQIAMPDPATDGQLKDLYEVKRGGRLLDVGCSVGKFLHKAKHFFEVEGVEINPITAAVARKDFRVHEDFLDRLKLPAEYDVVTLHQILYGVPDPVALLKDISNVLKKDGVLYINTPNSDSFAVETFKGKTNHFYGYTSLNVFNRKSLEYAAREAGFRVAKFRTEWLDIYVPDLVQLMSSPENFIHKRNVSMEGYETMIRNQDEMNSKFLMDLGTRGNYLVAILEKD